MAADTCPSSDEIVYSPFKPWFDFYNGSSQHCWNYASCVFSQADESRNQQFAAAALVMGLIPYTLRDIAWPESRNIPQSERLSMPVRILVRALAHEPVFKKNLARSEPSTKAITVIKLTITALMLSATYAGLALIEVYSKRTAVGCPYPVSVLTWYACALVPAALHTVLSKIREKRPYTPRYVLVDSSSSGIVAHHRDKNETPENVREDQALAEQEDNEWWGTKFMWAIYYLTGSLLYTSIMAVTVIELFVWVVISCATTAFSRLLALYISELFM